MQNRAILLAVFLAGVMSALIISCGQPKLPTPTSILPTPTSTPTPTPTVEPAPVKESIAFLELQDLPRALYKKIHGLPAQLHSFPRVLPVLLDKDGNPVIDFGFGGVALPIERFVVTLPSPNLGTEDLPPPLQGKNIRPGVMLVVGERPDGAPDYEILKRSVAKNEEATLEIFERQPNPRYSFTPLLPFEIQDLEELRPGDSLIFYGYTQGVDGKYFPTEKPATVSIISPGNSSIKMNGSVTGGDFGAPVFSYQCGVEKLIGITISSFAREGRETEVFVFGIKEVLKFVEASTGIRVQVKENKDPCPKEDPALKQRVIQALSDGRYDFPYALCDLKETCGLEKERQWVRPFQEVRVSKKDPAKEDIMGWGNAFVAGSYVSVVSSAVPFVRWLAQFNEGANYNVTHRILWGGSADGKSETEAQYEYLKFLGFDGSGNIAVFKRAQDSKFPMPPLPPSLVGNSKELKIGNALLSIGAADLKFFTGRKPFDIYQTIDPASLIGLSQAETNNLYIQGQMPPESNGSALCALRDGECEFIGFLYAPLTSEQAETLNRALTIEFVLKAMDEVICAYKELFCPNLSRLSSQARGIRPRTSQELTDKARIIELLRDQKPDSTSLLFDLVKPDLGVLAKYRTPISLFFFDETGSRIKDSSPVQGEALILSETYLLTSSALFPAAFTLTDSGLIQDTRDITSNTFFSVDGKKLEVRIVLPHALLFDNEMERFDVALIDQKNGYALLKKTTPGPFGNGATGSFPLVLRKDIAPNQEILLAYSQGILGGSYWMVDLVSPGKVTYVEADGSRLIINAFVSPEILGAPIYGKCDGQICAVGILTHAYPVYADKIKTEGFGVPLDFIFEKVKEKTGIDLRLGVQK